MNTGPNLRDLLAPLGVYRWEGSFQWGELQSEGEALDQVAAELVRLQREMNLATAQGEGLADLQALLACYAGSQDPDSLRLALAALLRVGGGSFTLAAINDAVRGCGIPAKVEETDSPQRLTVSFPANNIAPDDFKEMKRIIEDILPCHVQVDYFFETFTWSLLEARFTSWQEIEEAGLTWTGMENRVFW